MLAGPAPFAAVIPPAPAVLDEIMARTRALNFGMASDAETGALLRALAASKPGGRFLELGTGTGIATAWVLAGMDSVSTLTSVDISAEFQNVARALLGDDRRLTLVNGDALQFLAGSEPETYDLVFADAMPGKYEGLQQCLRVIKPGGFYIVDDMLPQPNWPEGHAEKIPAFLRQMQFHGGFTLVTMTWSTGVVIAVKLGHAPAHAR